MAGTQDMTLTLRRLRQNAFTRELAREVSLEQSRLIQPLFAVEGLSTPTPVPGLGETHRDTPDSLLKQVEKDLERGVQKFLLFGVPAQKSESTFSQDFTAEQVANLRKRFGTSIWLAVDVCLCSYTTHGHCGVLNAERTHVDNGKSVQALADAALAFAQAGADCVAPSDMMDGRVAAIRSRLDRAGHDYTTILSYSAKFHSRFYGPFRLAADSAPQKDKLGPDLQNRATYQIDPASPRDAYASSLRDANEGADFLMVKPALYYLDILKDLSTRIPKPWFAYEVSGEFAALELLAQNGLVDRGPAHVEAWTALFRAGASAVLSYGARHFYDWFTPGSRLAQNPPPRVGASERTLS